MRHRSSPGSQAHGAAHDCRVAGQERPVRLLWPSRTGRHCRPHAARRVRARPDDLLARRSRAARSIWCSRGASACRSCRATAASCRSPMPDPATSSARSPPSTAASAPPAPPPSAACRPWSLPQRAMLELIENNPKVATGGDPLPVHAPARDRPAAGGHRAAPHRGAARPPDAVGLEAAGAGRHRARASRSISACRRASWPC